MVAPIFKSVVETLEGHLLQVCVERAMSRAELCRMFRGGLLKSQRQKRGHAAGGASGTHEWPFDVPAQCDAPPPAAPLQMHSVDFAREDGAGVVDTSGHVTAAAQLIAHFR